MIVADTNIIAYTVTSSPYRDAAHHLLKTDDYWIAPRLWRSEMTSVLTRYLRQSVISLSEALRAQSLALQIMADGEYEVRPAEVLALAYESSCSPSDCEFVVLAKEMGCPLVTMNKKLVSAFPETARPL